MIQYDQGKLKPQSMHTTMHIGVVALVIIP